MGKTIYVGNLGSSASDADLDNLFSDHGTVCHAHVMGKRATRRPNGIGVVEMSSDEEAQAAIVALHGITLDGRVLTVSETHPVRSAADASPRGGAGPH